MPYANIEEKRHSMRGRYHFRYLAEPGFAEKEKERQRKNYEANREKIIARVLARRAALRAAASN